MSKYDVFISFKNTGSDGERTQDFFMAKDLYETLMFKGIQVFFSPESIKKNAVSNYSKYIDDAIEESDIFIAVGTSLDNLNSKWVYYEINTFRNELNNGNKDETRAGMISYISRNVNVNKLPLCLRSCEAFTDLNDVVEWVVNRKQSHDQMIARFAEGKRHANNLEITPGSYLLDHYKIISMIGRGGMSTVYLAYDEFRSKSVAVKVASNGNVMNFDSIAQSLNAEVDILKRLVHPYLPKIYDVIEKPDAMIIIMDFIEGRTLQNIIDEYGALPEEQVVKIGRQLCDALHYIHSLAPPIIYRDMKPSNVMVRPNGDIMLIDFGTAKEYDEKATSDTVCLGTMGYAAPEQFGGMGQSDARTDVYGLGVTLYHAVTGINPSEPPYEIKPISVCNPLLSKELEHIIIKATQRSPDERFQTIAEMGYYLNNPQKFKIHGTGILSRLFKREKKPQEKPQKSEPQFFVPPEVKDRLKARLPAMEQTGYVFGSGDTSVLSSNGVPATKELPNAEKIASASSMMIFNGDTELINSVAAVCVSFPENMSSLLHNSVYVYLFTALSRERVMEQIVNSGIGAQTKMEILSLIPVDTTVSIQMHSDQVRFDRNEFELLWNGQIGYGRFRVQKVTSRQPMISIETKIKVNGESISTISFETKY